MALVSDFDFELPERLIAQQPRPRGASRVLVVDRAAGAWREVTMADVPSLFRAGDLFVANDTRVFPARLIGRRDPSGGRAECLLLERIDDARWHALVHPGQKLRPGARLVFEDPVRAPGIRLRAMVHERLFFGRRVVSFEVEGAGSIDEAVDRLGHIPLPPYIHREDTELDRERYQTVFARVRGSIAAPTAGLHFTGDDIERLRQAGIGWTTVTHHVGYGTFKPVRVERVEEHEVDAETYEVPAQAAEAIAGVRRAGGRIVAVGTTTTRALESAAADDGPVAAGRATTRLFIHPGYRFRVVDALVTNFHLPRSSLLMLVAAFAGRDLILDAYRYAVAHDFRFYSYGDAMVIL
ncbi:MAG: tRNA preQ1(34) S-adenosylmethionine ribosyltransferase-isomerase QueA [Acidobacteriota bacterium]|jgi:S-adenosylmethionine:tRNA ribosyltransferase-isomerase|nr:MAG: tRNA preQ1(34) S-adenosylmethionine ribosyltransferase-isomerase QueA [Acidobacteriota bacterium]